jgi:hypothetical protein
MLVLTLNGTRDAPIINVHFGFLLGTEREGIPVTTLAPELQAMRNKTTFFCMVLAAILALDTGMRRGIASRASYQRENSA